VILDVRWTAWNWHSRVELIFDEARQFGSAAGLGVGDEAGCVMLH
jgi:hypothetical protein